MRRICRKHSETPQRYDELEPSELRRFVIVTLVYPAGAFHLDRREHTEYAPDVSWRNRDRRYTDQVG